MKVVSLIPARGGSKGIPYKNIVDVGGWPLLTFAVNASRESSVHETWVSTDDEQIKSVALLCGAKVLDRPIEFAQDNSTTEEVIQHFIENVECDIVVLIQPTSPLVIGNDINAGIEALESNGFDSVFSVVKSNDILVWNNQLEPINYDYKNRGNRQSRKESILIETGGVYIFRKESFQKYHNRLCGEIGYFEVPFWRSFEIDCEEDLIHIRKLVRV